MQVIVSWNKYIDLGKSIAKSIDIDFVCANVTRFSSDEANVCISKNIYNHDVYIVHSTDTPSDSNIMELLLVVDAVKRSGANSICAVIPYFGYARQDRVHMPGAPISAKLVADIMTVAGIDKVISLDLHSAQIEGFFNIPVTNLSSATIFAEDISKKYLDLTKLMIIAPDAGGTKRARQLANTLNIPDNIGIVDKIRLQPGMSQSMHLIGNVEGQDCIIVDDIVDSGGTLCNAADLILDFGATSVSAYITHGVLTNNAMEKISKSKLEKLIISDSIYQPDSQLFDKISMVSVSGLLSDTIGTLIKNRI